MKTNSASGLKLMELKRCPACGQTARQKVFAIQSSEVFQCSCCGLRYLDPCLSPDAMANAYESDETLTELHDFHEGYYDYGSLETGSKTRADFEKGLELAGKGIDATAEKKILDVGFGNGFFLALARQRGWAVEGIDTSSKNVEMAKKKFSLDLRRGDFEREIPDRPAYDAVAFWDVIEHIPDPKPVLQKVKRVLKPGGRALIAVPNDRNLLMIISSLLYKISAGAFRLGVNKLYFLEHVSYYSPKTLNALFENNGFRMLDSFLTNTDLAKYKLPLWEKLTAGTLLQIGHWLRLNNRFVAAFQVKS